MPSVRQLVDIYMYTYVCVSGNPQPEAIGHTQTCLQPESGAGTMHSLQPCQLGNDSLLNTQSVRGSCTLGAESPGWAWHASSRRSQMPEPCVFHPCSQPQKILHCAGPSQLGSPRLHVPLLCNRWCCWMSLLRPAHLMTWTRMCTGLALPQSNPGVAHPCSCDLPCPPMASLLAESMRL